MNLIIEAHYSCERREHVFMVLWEYTIISLNDKKCIKKNSLKTNEVIYIYIYIYIYMRETGKKSGRKKKTTNEKLK